VSQSMSVMHYRLRVTFWNDPTTVKSHALYIGMMLAKCPLFRYQRHLHGFSGDSHDVIPAWSSHSLSPHFCMIVILCCTLAQLQHLNHSKYSALSMIRNISIAGLSLRALLSPDFKNIIINLNILLQLIIIRELSESVGSSHFSRSESGTYATATLESR